MDTNTSIMQQALSLPAWIKSTVGAAADATSALDNHVLKTTRNVVLTGDGCGRAAALAARPLFETKNTFQGTGMYPGIETEIMSPVEFACNYRTALEINPQRQSKYIVCAFLSDGNEETSALCSKRMTELGGQYINFEDCEDAGEGRLYGYARAVLAAQQLGLRVRDLQESGNAEPAYADALASYADGFNEELLLILKQKAAVIARKWKDVGVGLIQFVAAGQDMASSELGCDVAIAEYGLFATVSDCEEWNHIDVFCNNNAQIACVVFDNASNPARSRTLETIRCMQSLGRQITVITDDHAQSALEQVDVICLPKPTHDFFNPLLQHLPACLLLDAYAGLQSGTCE